MGGCQTQPVSGVGIHVEGRHRQLLAVKHRQEASKQTSMIDREAGSRTTRYGLMLNDRTQNRTCFLHVQGCAVLSFMGEQELVNGERSIDVRVNCSQRIQGRLKGANIGQHALGSHVEMMKMR